MEHKRIIIILITILAAACVVIASVLVSVRRKNDYLPETAVEDTVKLLSDAGIDIDRDVISTKRQSGKVFLCETDDYNSSVAQLISEDEVRTTYETPDGEIIVMRGGELFEMKNDYSFRYSESGEKTVLPDLSEEADVSSAIGETKKEIVSAVTDFLDRGSRGFKLSGQIKVVTVVDKICTVGEKYYAVCSRTIDGVEITDNTVICTYENGEVTGAEGVWCFLTGGEVYSAQLDGILNILFNVRGEITPAENERARITDIGMCYSLYYYGGGEDFCLIPCWQVTTEKDGIFVFNALDSTLYTKK